MLARVTWTLYSRQSPVATAQLFSVERTLQEARITENTESAYTDTLWYRCELHLAQRLRLGEVPPLPTHAGPYVL